jgi:tetratricopeptide (TPR) repeat protein
VGKRRNVKKQIGSLNVQASSLEMLQDQLQALIQQKKYQQALTKWQNIHRNHPEAEITPSEAALYSLLGQQEYHQEHYEAAATALKKSLDLEPSPEVNYWLAKTWLAMDQLVQALALMQSAFEQNQLSKDYAGCYLKLLVLKGDRDALETLITQKSNRFYAPQLHWARGALALQAGELEKALNHFEKMGRKATPGGSVEVWTTYVQQQLGNWDLAAEALGLQVKPGPFQSVLSAHLPKHLALQKLVLLQLTAQPQVARRVMQSMRNDPQQRENLLLQEFLNLIEAKRYHSAAHVFQELDHTTKMDPKIQKLQAPLMLMAGQQAWDSSEEQCTETFWTHLLKQSFEPQLAFRLQEVLEFNDSFRERQRVLSQLIDWLRTEAKQHPQNWPPQRFNPTLAKFHCLTVDTLLSLSQVKKAVKVLQEAQALAPDLPDVIGRQGLALYAENKIQEAIPLLQQALEGGCGYAKVYTVLLEAWESLGEKAKIKEIRQAFGKEFGDFHTPLQDIPVWMDTLTVRSYYMFADLCDRDDEEAPFLACQIFAESVMDDPNNNQRVSFNQQLANTKWKSLLKPLTPEAKIPVLQAIALCLQKFAKRNKKGVMGLLNEYTQALAGLGEQYPEAKMAHMVLQVLKESKADRLEPVLRRYLDRQPQPATALAQLQLKAYQFSDTKILLPFLDEALKREPQNPLLLLAEATTLPRASPKYQELREAGFELARRVQDAQALQAYRDEEALQATLVSEQVFPDLMATQDGHMGLEELLQRMIEKMLGGNAPPELLEKMLPELKSMLEGASLEEEEDDDDDNFGSNPFGFGFPFGFGNQSESSSRGKRR